MDEAQHTTTGGAEGAELRSRARRMPGGHWPVLLVAALLGVGLLTWAARWTSPPTLSPSAAPQEHLTMPLQVRSVPEHSTPVIPAVKAYLGIRGKTFHHGAVQGVKVLEVFAGSPAARAGLRADHEPSRVPAHVIVGVNGRPIRSEEDLGQILAESIPGTQIQLFLTNATGRLSEVIAVTLGAAREAAPPAMDETSSRQQTLAVGGS